MKKTKKEKLKKAGWKVGSAADFLGLSEEEAAMVELKIALARDLKRRRQSKNLTQTQFARLLHSSQSRVAKMEAGDRSVSLDLLLKSLLSLGVSPKQLAKIFSSLSTA
jgi:DNA-binding transcriptional regulator YiaG